MKRQVVGQAFRVAVANLAEGGNPDQGHNATKVRSGFAYQNILTRAGGMGTNALIAGTPLGPQTASLTVADNDFTTGRALLYLGEYTLIPHVDYTPGAGVNATATALAAAIDLLPQYTAQAVGAVVSITSTLQPVEQVVFRVGYEGTIENFTPLVPATGYMAPGNPRISAPVLS